MSTYVVQAIQNHPATFLTILALFTLIATVAVIEGLRVATVESRTSDALDLDDIR